ncbi:Chaperone surA [Gossypium australe]|uniref:Chaperone surA n=1 Tax=Gossypium australe TaxID=47621 RepID=A0A5B6X0D9_9ROSI|nr:Chaperone surA [Gossypium australe]
MDPNRGIADEVESNAPAPAQGTSSSDFRLVTGRQGGEAKEAFFQMMNEWFTQYIRTNSAAQQPPPPPNPQPIPVTPQGVELLRLNKAPVDKICKHGAEEFRANVDDDLERLNLKEFVVVVGQACTAEDFSCGYKKVDSDAKDSRKIRNFKIRLVNRMHQWDIRIEIVEIYM